MMESNKVKYKKLTAKYQVLKRYWNLIYCYMYM